MNVYQKRFEIEKYLKSISLKDGDIFFRHSNAKGPFNIPFSKIVAFLTKSDFSHASILIHIGNEPFLLEVNEKGTQLCRIVDWLEMCWNNKFAVYRYKNIDNNISNVRNSILDFLKRDPEYDFTFNEESKFYCTESVVEIYNNVGVILYEGHTIKDSVPFIPYVILRIGNFFVSKLSNCSIPFNKKMYFVGNETKGLMASKEIDLITNESQLR